ncbi:MAG: carboxypeptidase-like regulatory domain-containing protein, partial [Bacteroidia bacterium]|nr:carboxypeptidase-like regulatory domain-containing protein [Bacteroidia bacterium]
MRILIVVTLALFTTTSWAQRGERPTTSNNAKFKVSGTVIDRSSGTPLEFATIAFVDSQGKIVEGGITNSDGAYSIDIPKGIYDIRFEFISYKTEVLTGENIDKNTVLPAVTMSLDSEALDEVVIRAETTEVQIRLDKKVYNIGK